MHRLQPVAHIGKRTTDDHAHCIIEITLAHFLFDGNERNLGRIGGRNGALLVVVVGHGKPVI